MHPLDLSMIVAMTPGGVIGNEGKLPWHLPSDLKRFKEITMEIGTVIMGRTTYESILARNGKPLPERKHIVLTRKPIASEYESVCFVGSSEEACQKVASYGGRACVIGGAEIYKLFLSNPCVSKVYVTCVYTSTCGDAHFPIPKRGLCAEWKCTRDSEDVQCPTDEYKMSFFVYHRQ